MTDTAPHPDAVLPGNKLIEPRWRRWLLLMDVVLILGLGLLLWDLWRGRVQYERAQAQETEQSEPQAR